MGAVIEIAAAPEDLHAVTQLRAEVFEREWGIPVAPAEDLDGGRVWHLIARQSSQGRVVGALTILDVTREESLLRSCHLDFAEGMRVARYSHLAVAKQASGLGIPLQVMVAAREQIIGPW